MLRGRHSRAALAASRSAIPERTGPLLYEEFLKLLSER